MNKITRFQDVADAAAHLAEDAQVAAEVREEISKNELVAHLLEMRLAKNMTQQQVAQSMGCDASTVSRIESDSDRQLQWKDVVGYAQALNLQISVLFDDCSLPAADRIKHCVLKIDSDLKKLADLAREIGGEDQISNEINRFYKQVLFNFLVRFNDNYKTLPSVKISPRAVECSSASSRVERYSVVASRPADVKAASTGFKPMEA